MPKPYRGGYIRANSVWLDEATIRKAAEAGGIAFREELVQQVNEALNSGLLLLALETDPPPQKEVRDLVAHVGRAVAGTGKALFALRDEQSQVAEAARTEVSNAAVMAGFEDLEDLLSKAEALRGWLATFERALSDNKGRPKAPERHLVGRLCALYEEAGGRVSVSWDPYEEGFRGQTLDFVNVIFADPRVASELPSDRTDTGNLIKEWRKAAKMRGRQ